MPKRSVAHKNYLEKVMFICAIARPRWDHATKWDGKIGIWPIGREVKAQKSSVNRPAGTVLWRNEPVNREKYLHLLTDYVIPSIIGKVASR